MKSRGAKESRLVKQISRLTRGGFIEEQKQRGLRS
jgi:hypothetical protein